MENTGKPDIPSSGKRTRRAADSKKAQPQSALSADRVLDELAAVAFANATDFVEVTEEGRARVRPTEELSREKQSAITSIRSTSNGVEIKLGDKLQALKLLGNYLGAFRPDQEIEDLDGARAGVFGEEQRREED